jgi:hypothetical protein
MEETIVFTLNYPIFNYYKIGIKDCNLVKHKL